MGKRFWGVRTIRRGARANRGPRPTAWRGDRGQTSIEYLGIIAVVVAIILVLTTTDFGGMIASAISNKISQVTGI
ncbi:Flp family type IVb pilin [Streptomyces varsoviensis]|uniref:Flp family type IVb pilin n=1 Tax=Streptomyces varsoviensis TaxID=67373 RepID=UPI0004C92077